MNQKQKEYAITRVEEIARNKCRKIVDNHTVEKIELSPQERLAAFKKGEFKINKSIYQIDRYLDVMQLIAFNAERPEFHDKTATSKLCNAIDKKLSKIKDEIMLGDSDKALKLIAKFESEVN